MAETTHRMRTVFGSWLFAYRKLHDLTQTRVGELIGVNQSNAARIENGERQIDYDLVVALHSAFALKYHDVDLDDMLIKADLKPVGGSAPGGALQLSLEGSASEPSPALPNHGENETHHADDRQKLRSEILAAIRHGKLSDRTIDALLRALVALNEELENREGTESRAAQRSNLRTVAAHS